MRRRRLLQGLGAAAVGSLAGCAGRLEEITGSVGGGRTIGDTATHNGVELTPTKFITPTSMQRRRQGNTGEMNAEDGATFLLTHLDIVHNGDSEQEFPSTRPVDAINCYYDGEEVDDGGGWAEVTSAYIVEGKVLTTFASALEENDAATGGVYPGTEADGWVFNKLAENFDPSKLELRVTWNAQAFSNSGTTQTWTYTEDAEASIEDVEGDGEGVTLG